MAGFLMCYFGRKGTTIAFTIPTYFVGYMIVAYADNLTTVIVGRLLTGMGLGFTLTVPNVYIVEITDPEYRGVLGVLPNFFCQIGIFSTYVLGRFFDWRMLAFSCKNFTTFLDIELIITREAKPRGVYILLFSDWSCWTSWGVSV